MTNPKLRRGRHSESGAHYVVTTVCKDRIPLFARPSLAKAVIGEIQNTANTVGVVSHAWVVMPDHVHWLFELRLGALFRHVQAFKSRSAIATNRLRGMQGSVWQAGFYDHRLRSDEDLLHQARYIVANPLRKGLVARIEGYPHWACRWIKTQDDLFL